MKFQIGDLVRAGTHTGTVTDVGTVLIQVKILDGDSRVVCPWELVRIRGSHDSPSSDFVTPR
jgi:small-conductance mechanosensitive channel